MRKSASVSLPLALRFMLLLAAAMLSLLLVYVRSLLSKFVIVNLPAF